jgi:hypothetical protein
MMNLYFLARKVCLKGKSISIKNYLINPLLWLLSKIMKSNLYMVSLIEIKKIYCCNIQKKKRENRLDSKWRWRHNTLWCWSWRNKIFYL